MEVVETTRDEVKSLLAMISGAYPNYKPPDKTLTVNVWHMALADYDKEVIIMGLKAYMISDTSGFAPSVGQLLAKVQNIIYPQAISDMEAWRMVKRAISNSIYHSQEEYSKLPRVVQKVVGSPQALRTWAMDEEYNDSVTMSHFLRCYRTEVAREREKQIMPQDIKAVIEKTQSALSIEKSTTE